MAGRVIKCIHSTCDTVMATTSLQWEASDWIALTLIALLIISVAASIFLIRGIRIKDYDSLSSMPLADITIHEKTFRVGR